MILRHLLHQNDVGLPSIAAAMDTLMVTNLVHSVRRAGFKFAFGRGGLAILSPIKWIMLFAA